MVDFAAYTQMTDARMPKLNNKINMIGRDLERRRLTALAASPQAEMLALYGRRRIGKTFLIEEHLGPLAGSFVHVTGKNQGNRQAQIAVFQAAVERSLFGGARLPVFANWDQAFAQLALGVRQQSLAHPDQPVVVFLDELPWLATRRSGLLESLDHAWNTELRRIPQLKLILCGSAAAWIIRHLVDAKGGLHNRLTASLRLMPFNLCETKTYLAARGVRLRERQVLDVFMALGGVPYYLNFAGRGLSAAQIVAETCLGSHSHLRGELQRLFTSLFDEGSHHLNIVRKLAIRQEGLTREEVAEACAISTGGQLSLWLSELIEAGFIDEATPFGRKSKETRYRVIDEFTLFALRWTQRLSRGVLAQQDPSQWWSAQVGTPAYRAWAGYAFEGVCLKHHENIKRALGFGAVATKSGTWRHKAKPGESEPGAQVDLLFDRADHVFTICEIKHCEGLFRIDKKYAAELSRKAAVFQSHVARGRQVFLALITTEGVAANDYKTAIVDNDVTLSALF